MKAVLVVLVVAGVGFFVMKSSMSSTEADFDPTEQGREIRETITTCKDWTEVLDRAKEPSKWRNAPSNFDFSYRDRFNDKTRQTITQQLESNKLMYGFSFFYRFSDAVTFAVNFDGKGKFLDIQDKEGKDDLMDSAGG